MRKILGTFVVALLLGTPVLAQPVIVGDPTSAGFGTTASGTGGYMWFNVLLANTGSGSPSAIGGVSLAAMVGGPWAAAHLSMPPNYGTDGVNSENRYSGVQMATFLGATASNYAFGTTLVTPSGDYPTSTSGYFTTSFGNYLTYGIDNQSSVVTPVSNGMILARLYFGWDGIPLGANSVSVSLIAESGNPAQGPSIFNASTTPSLGTYVIGSQVFSAPSTFTITAPTGTFSITAYTSTSWVYQNAPVTTQDRHQATLTISATDTWGNTTYTVTVAQTGPGVVTPTQNWIAGSTVTPTGAAPVVWTVPASTTFSGTLVGGRVIGTVNSTSPNGGNQALAGNCTVTVTVQGDKSGPSNQATAQASLTVRPLGAIDTGVGQVGGADKTDLNGRFGGKSPYTTWDQNLFNLDGSSGSIAPIQKTILNKILGGVVIN